MLNLLNEMKLYIERTEVSIDAAYGLCRSLEKLQADDSMPELYKKITRRTTASDITDDHVDAVSSQLDYSPGGWDMVPPKEIIAAVFNSCR